MLKSNLFTIIGIVIGINFLINLIIGLYPELEKIQAAGETQTDIVANGIQTVVLVGIVPILLSGVAKFKSEKYWFVPLILIALTFAMPVLLPLIIIG